MGFDESVLEGLDAGLDGAVGIGVSAAMTEAFLGVAAAHARGDAEAARAGLSQVMAW
jgi:dihydrodipicolinate synthase/N-acetylneuraminate lyase